MALDKLVDSTQLDSNLTNVANAIRAKSGMSEQISFPQGFVDAVDAIPVGGGNDWTTIIDTTLESDVSRLFYGNLAYKEVELWLEWDSAQSMKFFYALNVPNASANMAGYHNVQDTSARSIGAFYMKAFINPHRKVCSAYEYSLYGGVNKDQAAQPWMLISSNGSGAIPVDLLTSDNITSISFANANTDGVVPAGTRVVLRGR